MNILEQAADCLEKGERYEVLGDVYKLIIPIYEGAREFEVRIMFVLYFSKQIPELLLYYFVLHSVLDF